MIKVVQPQSPKEFEAYYQLRWETLRAPWNQPKGSEKDDQEENSIHFMAVENGIVLGVCRLQFNSPKEAQIRFMGVSDVARKKGVGRMLIQHAEQYAIQQQRHYMILQARDYAVNFYEKCGYTIKEKTFLLWNSIQHYLMEKNLN